MMHYISDEAREQIRSEIRRAIDEYGLAKVLDDPERTVYMPWDELKPFLKEMGYLERGKE